MEMEIALRIGVKPEKIIWNGPVKNYEKARQLFYLEWFRCRYMPLISHGRLPRKIMLASLGTQL